MHFPLWNGILFSSLFVIDVDQPSRYQLSFTFPLVRVSVQITEAFYPLKDCSLCD